MASAPLERFGPSVAAAPQRGRSSPLSKTRMGFTGTGKRPPGPESDTVNSLRRYSVRCTTRNVVEEFILFANRIFAISSRLSTSRNNYDSGEGGPPAKSKQRSSSRNKLCRPLSILLTAHGFIFSCEMSSKIAVHCYQLWASDHGLSFQVRPHNSRCLSDIRPQSWGGHFSLSSFYLSSSSVVRSLCFPFT